ncbi:MAG: hypothetical protein AAFO77_03205 [Pseudomonadota bacterium]
MHTQNSNSNLDLGFAASRMSGLKNNPSDLHGYEREMRYAWLWSTVQKLFLLGFLGLIVIVGLWPATTPYVAPVLLFAGSMGSVTWFTIKVRAMRKSDAKRSADLAALRGDESSEKAKEKQ